MGLGEEPLGCLRGSVGMGVPPAWLPISELPTLQPLL